MSGATGGLWNARVVAYRLGTTDVLGETFSDPNGAYSLTLEPDVRFDLAVEPQSGTGLIGMRREDITLAVGQEMEEDILLASVPVVRGHLIDAERRPRRGTKVLALHPVDVEDASARAHIPDALVVAQCGSDTDGWFVLRGLAPGAYELVVEDPAWMFPSRVSIRTDGPEESFVVVPALTLDLEVQDAETEEPVRSFTVRVRAGDRTLLEAQGIHGVFSRRVPWPGPRDLPDNVLVEVSAPGLVTSGPVPQTWKTKQRICLYPEREPNTAVRVSFEGIGPYHGPLVARLSAKSGATVGSVRFDRTGDGVYRAALPRGRWDAIFIPELLYGRETWGAEVEITAEKGATLTRVLPAGGSLTFFPPPGADPTPVRIVGADGVEMLVLVPREGACVEGIPAGPCRLGYDRRAEVLENRFLVYTKWLPDVEAVVGSSQEVRLPAE